MACVLHPFLEHAFQPGDPDARIVRGNADDFCNLAVAQPVEDERDDQPVLRRKRRLVVAGNMIALWAFGLVVEGKLGACKTLFVYLGIGVLHGAIVQFLMLGGAQNYCLGASAIIYGFMAMCLIWGAIPISLLSRWLE